MAERFNFLLGNTLIDPRRRQDGTRSVSSRASGEGDGGDVGGTGGDYGATGGGVDSGEYDGEYDGGGYDAGSEGSSGNQDPPVEDEAPVQVPAPPKPGYKPIPFRPNEVAFLPNKDGPSGMIGEGADNFTAPAGYGRRNPFNLFDTMLTGGAGVPDDASRRRTAGSLLGG